MRQKAKKLNQSIHQAPSLTPHYTQPPRHWQHCISVLLVDVLSSQSADAAAFKTS